MLLDRTTTARSNVAEVSSRRPDIRHDTRQGCAHRASRGISVGAAQAAPSSAEIVPPKSRIRPGVYYKALPGHGIGALNGRLNKGFKVPPCSGCPDPPRRRRLPATRCTGVAARPRRPMRCSCQWRPTGRNRQVTAGAACRSWNRPSRKRQAHSHPLWRCPPAIATYRHRCTPWKSMRLGRNRRHRPKPIPCQSNGCNRLYLGRNRRL